MEAKKGSKGVRRWIIRGAIVVAAIALAVYLTLPRPLLVAAVPLERGTMRVELDGEGRTRLRDQFVVSAPVTGELERITLRVGDVVRRGDVIARMRAPARDPAQLEELRQRVEAATHVREQMLEAGRQASIALEAARRERDRLRQLEETGALSRQEIDQADDRVALATREEESTRHRSAAAAAEIAAIRASMVTANAPTTREVVVRAPVSGAVMRVVEPSRRAVMAGGPLVVLGDPKGIEIVVDLLSTDAVRVRPGDRVRIEGWGGEQELRARVRRVEPVGVTKISALGIEEQRVDVIADLIDGDVRLGDGYRVEARIVVSETPGVLKAPTSALFRSGESWALFVVRDGVARKAIVRVGERTPFETEIVDGVGQGEMVIPFPSDRIDEGVQVEIDTSTAARSSGA